ncbi:DNA/RNA non-specific endonuclease [Sphingosinicella sp. LY1275]|uniref:DNA/RNA non-specific endonuclease n=1 Tax=Sphingosinicella sp. LY1275 TaxID=3095379 RepID=UPI002ADEED6D|nr:DNA/RNA non-specific endonuclease [Sphingosinicella sp. LY1275]MEA1015579.1 DNA/RNA non-specific endonuclease [Sphingosinicella sp. LY1275]
MRLSFFLALLALIPTAPAAAAEAELHTFHCLHGCPVGAPATNDTIVREIYTLSSNDITKLADWVAYKVTPATIGASESRNWAKDPWLSNDETLSPAEYTGAPAALHIDRGHQAPLASFSGTPSAADTNILANITPQASALNQGPWVRLENQERALAQQSGKAVFVYTGPLFERMMKPLPGTTKMHRVPSGYWKVVATEDGRMTGFLFDQATPKAASHCAGRTSLEQIQLRARLILFPTKTGSFTSLDKALGCTGPMPPAPQPSEIPAS